MFSSWKIDQQGKHAVHQVLDRHMSRIATPGDRIARGADEVQRKGNLFRENSAGKLGL
jgi:hypothetical protein